MSSYQCDHDRHINLTMNWETERQRLASIEETLDPTTLIVLSRIGVRAGWQCLEIGAGAGSIAHWLNQQVGPEGHVVATDLETIFLQSIEASNLEVRNHDIVADSLEEDVFDLVHARAVLEHLPERAVALQKMTAATRSGGWLMIEDADYVSFTAADPRHSDLFDRAQRAFLGVLSAKGWDLT